MRACAIGIAVGLCLIVVGAASAQAGGVIELVCTYQNNSVPSMTVTVDVTGRRAKGRDMSYHGEVPFSPAEITSDMVSWQNEIAEGNTGLHHTARWILDRNTGSLGIITSQSESHYVCKVGSKLF
jgi:hypothetical protein